MIPSSKIYRLKSSGPRIEPCGTPYGKIFIAVWWREQVCLRAFLTFLIFPIRMPMLRRLYDWKTETESEIIHIASNMPRLLSEANKVLSQEVSLVVLHTEFSLLYREWLETQSRSTDSPGRFDRLLLLVQEDEWKVINSVSFPPLCYPCTNCTIHLPSCVVQ